MRGWINVPVAGQQVGVQTRHITFIEPDAAGTMIRFISSGDRMVVKLPFEKVWKLIQEAQNASE